jgi:hypothetical protein
MITHNIPDMTIRDYFAASALNGLIEFDRLVKKEAMWEFSEFTDPNHQPCLPDIPKDCFRLVEAAYVVADAMMIAREQRTPYKTWDGND